MNEMLVQTLGENAREAEVILRKSWHCEEESGAWKQWQTALVEHTLIRCLQANAIDVENGQHATICRRAWWTG